MATQNNVSQPKSDHPQAADATAEEPKLEADASADPKADEAAMDAEIEAMKKRLAEMEAEAEAEKHNSAQDGLVGANVAGGPPGGPDSDARSVYVGQVDYGATPEELQAYFKDCGTINRVTIICNKHSGQPKGYAYIEFVDENAVKNALILNDSTFRGRQLKVTPKRTNVPGLARGRGRGRGFRGRGRGYYRGYHRGRYTPY